MSPRAFGTNNIRVIETPFVADTPAKPAQAENSGCLRSWAAWSLGAAWWLAPTWRMTPSAASIRSKNISGLSVLTSVPESKRKDLDKKSALTSDPASYEAEAFRSLRTALSFLGPEKDRKTVLFTSANPAEGKSYCSLNYAVALAHTGLRTLLIDADLRRPNLSKVVLG